MRSRLQMFVHGTHASAKTDDSDDAEEEDYDDEVYDSQGRRLYSRKTFIIAALFLAIFGIVFSRMVSAPGVDGVSLASKWGLSAYPFIKDAWRQCDGQGREGTFVPTMHLNFLVMVMGDLPHPEIWFDFFNSAPAGSWSLYIHCKDASVCTPNLERSGIAKIAKVVPSVFSAWCLDLVSPMIQLLKYAQMEKTVIPKGAPEKFIIISAEHLPIKPFHLIRAELGRHPNASDYCLYPTENWGYARVNNATIQAVGSQWLILSKMDAEKLTSAMPEPTALAAVIVPPVENLTVPEFFNLHCIDETAVFSQIFGLFHADGPMEQEFFAPGVGPLKYPAAHEQGCCRTWGFMQGHGTDETDRAWVSTYAKVSPLAQILVDLLHTPDSKVIGPATHTDLGGGEVIWVVESLGPEGMRILRDSPFLFGRKFANNASLPGFTAAILK